MAKIGSLKIPHAKGPWDALLLVDRVPKGGDGLRPTRTTIAYVISFDNFCCLTVHSMIQVQPLAVQKHSNIGGKIQTMSSVSLVLSIKKDSHTWRNFLVRSGFHEL